MLFGFTFWFAGCKGKLTEENKEHLAERCALLMVLAFGETLIGFGNAITAASNLFLPIMQFILIVGLFLVYLNEIVNLLDLNSIRSGKGYLVLSAWMTFCIANVTAGFELATNGKGLMALDGDLYFSLSIAVFLASFMLYRPFNKYRRISVGRVVARLIMCVLVMGQASAVVMATNSFLANSAIDAETASIISGYASGLMMIVAVAAVFAVLLIDRVAVRRERKRIDQRPPEA